MEGCPCWQVSMPLEDPSPLHSLPLHPLPSADAWTAREDEGCEGSHVGRWFLIMFFFWTRCIELWFQRKNQMYPANHVRVFADSIARHGKSNTCFGGRSALGDCSQYHSCVMSGWLVYWTCSSWTWKIGWSQWGFNYYSSLPYAVCIPLPSRFLSQKTSKDSQFCMVKLSKF